MAAGVLLYGADPRIVLDEDDDVRALVVDAALELATKADAQRRIDIANKVAKALAGE
jgi:hypothetical protein